MTYSARYKELYLTPDTNPLHPPKPTVGRWVHFYDHNLEGKTHARDGRATLNGQDAGPYPALVVQAFDGPYVNLRVFAYGGDWSEGSVAEKGDRSSGGETKRYWVWQPHV